jgi:hypothetical protein
MPRRTSTAPAAKVPPRCAPPTAAARVGIALPLDWLVIDLLTFVMTDAAESLALMPLCHMTSHTHRGSWREFRAISTVWV